MRQLLRVFTALPFAETAVSEGERADARLVDVRWSLAPIAGLLLGLVAFLTQQLTIGPVGPLVSGVAIVGVLAATTGAVSHRSLATLAARLADGADGRGQPLARPAPGIGAQQLALVLIVLLQVTLLQRIHAAPQMLVVVPMAGVLAQAVLLTGADDVPLRPPGSADRISAGLLAILVLPLPLLLSGLSHTPFGVNGELAGTPGVVLAAAAVSVGVAVGMLTRAWALSRFQVLDTAGWRVIGLAAETASLMVIAIRVA